MKKQNRKKSGKNRRKTGASGKSAAARRQSKRQLAVPLPAEEQLQAADDSTISVAEPAAESTTESAPPEQEPATPVAEPVAPTPPLPLPEQASKLPAVESAPAPPLHSRRNAWLTIGSIIVAILLMWAAGNFFAAKLRIGNTTVSGRTGGHALEMLITGQAASYRLGITYPDGHVQHFPLSQLGIKPDAAGTVARARSLQLTPSHLLTWWRPVPVKLSLRVDNPALARFIAQHARIVTTPARPAHIGIDAGKVITAPETLGKQFGFMNAAGTLLDAARRLQTKPLLMTSVALEPETTTQSLAGVKGQLEAILSQRISIKVGEQTVTPSRGDIGTWLTITPTGSSAKVAVNQSEVDAYLHDVAASGGTAPRSQVISDATGAVLTAGAKGVSVGDTDAAASDLGKHLLEAGGNSLTLPVTLTPFKTVYAPTSGKWIEVDTNTKRMYAWDQGELVRTFLVSAGAAATPTVTGRFAIYAKYRSQDMRGENADGSNYFQPDVPYVNYFYRDYAIHGNYWRPSSYFGNVNSSHGCVGIPVSDGAWMYSWAPVGTPVIVHS